MSFATQVTLPDIAEAAAEWAKRNAEFNAACNQRDDAITDAALDTEEAAQRRLEALILGYADLLDERRLKRETRLNAHVVSVCQKAAVLLKDAALAVEVGADPGEAEVPRA